MSLKTFLKENKLIAIIISLILSIFGISLIINIYNVQSYPIVGDIWTTEFNVIGRGDLEVSGFNGTEFGKDIEFVQIRCGDKEVSAKPFIVFDLDNPVDKSKGIIVEDYSCIFSSSYLDVKVLTTGKHTIQFKFGNDIDYSYNFASEKEEKPIKIILPDGSSIIKDRDNKSFEIRDKRENSAVTNIKSNVKMNVEIKDGKLKWGSNEAGYYIHNTSKKTFIKGYKICIEDEFEVKYAGTLMEEKTWINCIYYGPQYYTFENLTYDIELKKYVLRNITINQVNFTVLSDNVKRIDFADERDWNPKATVAYDPLTSNYTEGLVSCWSLDTDGTDDYGIYDLTNISGTTLVNGKVGNARYFDGTKDYMRNETFDYSIFSSNLTLAFWSNFSSWVQYDRYFIIYQDATNYFQISNSNYRIVANGKYGEATERAARGNNSFLANLFYFITITYDNDANVWTVFNNGVDVTESGGTGYGIGTYTGVTIGMRNDLASNDVQGTMDEFMLWSRILNQSEILEVYNSSVGSSCAAIIATGEEEVEDSTPPVITQISPSNNSINTSIPVKLWYNVTDASDINNCTLIINSIANTTDSSITKNTPQFLSFSASNGDYNWSVNCTDASNNIGNSGTWNISINVPTDSCETTITSNHVYLCSDYCDLGNVDANGYNITFTEEGDWKGNLTNYDLLWVNSTSCVPWIST